MGLVVKQYTHIDGTPAKPNEVNANEATLYTVINGQLDWDNLKAALANAANGLVKLNASGDVPLAQIPAVLTGKSADKWGGKSLGASLDILTGNKLTHNSADVIVDGPKVYHAVYN